MTKEGRTGYRANQEDVRHGQMWDRTSDGDGASTRSVTLGLVPAPDIPEEIAYELADELPGLLNRNIDGHLDWDISIVCDPLTGAEQEEPGILDETHKLLQREGWGYAICLTDLPVLRDGQVVIADADQTRGVGGISLPSLGVTLLRKRTLEAILHLVSEMHQGTSDSDRDREGQRQQDTGGGEEGAGKSAKEGRLRGRGSRQLIGNRLTERLSPIKRITPSEEDMDVDVRFVSSRTSGCLRLLAGMVFANRPGRLFPAMKGTVAAAFATAAFSLATSDTWELGSSLGVARLLVLMVFSIVTLTVWIIVAHGLWERSTRQGSPELKRLYNAATALTLSVTTISAYAGLFALTFAAAWGLLPSSLLQSMLMQPTSLGLYLALGWLAASLATFASALGSGLEDDERVKNATFGYRQKRRAEESKEESQQIEEE